MKHFATDGAQDGIPVRSRNDIKVTLYFELDYHKVHNALYF